MISGFVRMRFYAAFVVSALLLFGVGAPNQSFAQEAQEPSDLERELLSILPPNPDRESAANDIDLRDLLPEPQEANAGSQVADDDSPPIPATPVALPGSDFETLGYRSPLPEIQPVNSKGYFRVLPQGAGRTLYANELFSLHLNESQYHTDGSVVKCYFDIGWTVALVAILNVDANFVITPEWLNENIKPYAASKGRELCPHRDIEQVRVQIHLAGFDMNFSTGEPYFIPSQLSSYKYEKFFPDERTFSTYNFEHRDPESYIRYYYLNDRLASRGFILALFSGSGEGNGYYSFFFEKDIKSGSYIDFVKLQKEIYVKGEEIRRREAKDRAIFKALLGAAAKNFGTNEDAYECSVTHDLGTSPPWYCNK